MEIELVKYINCYSKGEWKNDIPFHSICRCEGGFDSPYCSRSKGCLNKLRDDCYWKQYQFEVDTNYYPSDEEVTNYEDKRVLKLKNVEGRPYYMDGSSMLRLIIAAAENYNGPCDDADEAINDALEEIRMFSYSISKKRFRKILNKYFN
jgi:hypothetical protein